MNLFMSGIDEILQFAADGASLLFAYWWVWVPAMLAVAAYRAHFDLQRARYISEMQWVVLEVIPPPEIPYSSPKAADNMFAGLHASYTGGTGWRPQFFKGKVPDWFSFEVVSNGGQTMFCIRCPENQRNMVEALVYAQYPAAEIRIVPDYVQQTPEAFDPDAYDCFIAELIFTKDQAYPIRSYLEFEEGGGKDEYARLDPIAPLMEIMSALRPDEHVWLQYLVRPTGGDWAKEQQKVADKIVGKAEPQTGLHLVEQMLTLPFRAMQFMLEEFEVLPPSEPDKKKEEKEFSLQKLTPVQKDVLEQVERKLAKLAFKGGIRFCYLARKESFNMGRIGSVIGMFKQLYASNLNTFKPNPVATSKSKGIAPWMFPSDKGFFAESSTLKLKKRLYKAYRERKFTKAFTILTNEEMATLWHLPGLNVKAPLMPRVQSKKGTPPAILPTRE
jgi:hypothetical protein